MVGHLLVVHPVYLFVEKYIYQKDVSIIPKNIASGQHTSAKKYNINHPPQ